jgi:CelD/BcsL family acetyltransferase involved in cellulose biosynthesis
VIVANRASAIRTRLLDGFDDPSFGRAQWNALLQSGETDVVFLTWEFQRAWWETLGGGKLLLIVAQENDGIVALAPFYAKRYEIGLIGSGVSDWLDLIGNARDDEVVCALLATAREHAPASAEFDFNPVPARRGRAAQLDEAARRLGMKRWLKRAPVPIIDMAGNPGVAEAGTRKKSSLRHERLLRRSGTLEIEHLSDGRAIGCHLEAFFEQHNARWAGNHEGSAFDDAPNRAFIARLSEISATSRWLRFTRVLLDGRPVAFHFGFFYRGRYSWWRPSFDIELARYSPGEVLLRHVLFAAIDEGSTVFDFGSGDMPYKLRFATEIDKACWWGAY